MVNFPEVHSGLGIRAAMREKLSTVVGGREDNGRPPHPRTAALPGRPSVGPAPGRPRKLAEPLADPATWHAVDAAERWAGSGSTWPYAVLLGPGTATVRLTGPVPAVTVERAALAAANPVAQPGRAPSAYACLGSNGADLVFLDLALIPGVLTVEGDTTAANMLINGLTAQLVAAGAHRVASIEQWPQALDELEDEGAGKLAFLIWPHPDAETAARLHRAADLRPWLRIIVIGDTSGSRWPLTITADGVVTSLALGLSAATTGLPQQLEPRTVLPEAMPAVPPPTASAPALAAAEPKRNAAPELPPLSLDEHPGLLPLPPRDPALSIEPFAPSATPALAGGPS
jgi:hypothetical protein